MIVLLHISKMSLIELCMCVQATRMFSSRLHAIFSTPPGHSERAAEPFVARRRQQQKNAARGGQRASADGLRSGGAEGEQWRPLEGARLWPKIHKWHFYRLLFSFNVLPFY